MGFSRGVLSEGPARRKRLCGPFASVTEACASISSAESGVALGKALRRGARPSSTRAVALFVGLAEAMARASVRKLDEVTEKICKEKIESLKK